MFIDRAKIQVRGGGGGAGCVSFRREKFVPRGGPDGGDGGRGGAVILRADPSRSTLNDFHYRQHFFAERGKHGEGSQRSGRDGVDRVVPVPAGTAVYDDGDGTLLGDLTRNGDELLVAGGGRGGRGNARFATPTHQAPREAEDGRSGETRWLRLELRVLAEVGLVGFPNVGKSTLLARLTAAHPKVADYPFTTLVPHLGVATLDDHRSTVLADIPGLIAGAHKGAGLGHRFLQHLKRTRILLHMVDAADLPDRDPLADYRAIRHELEAYGAGLESRPELLAVSRADLLQDRERLQPLLAHCREREIPVLEISAVTGSGLQELKHRLLEALERHPEPPRPETPGPAPSAAAVRTEAEPGEPVITLRERRR